MTRNELFACIYIILSKHDVHGKLQLCRMVNECARGVYMCDKSTYTRMTDLLKILKSERMICIIPCWKHKFRHDLIYLCREYK